MPTLSACIRRAGKALDAADAEAIREIAREYLGDGMTNTEASKRAIDDYLGILAEDRADMLLDLNNAGGDITPFTGGVRTSRLQQERGDNLRQLRQQAEAADRAREDAAAGLRAQEENRLKQPQVRYGFTEDDIQAANNDPSSPEAQGMKYLQTAEEMSQAADGRKTNKLLRGASNLTDKTNNKGRDVTLAMVPTRNLVDFLPDDMKPVADKINYLNKRMTGRESQLVNQVSNVVDPWTKLRSSNREASDLMTGIMQRSTLLQVDPSAEYAPRIDIAAKRRQLRKLHDKMESGVKGPGKIRQDIRSIEASLLQEEKRKSDHARLKALFDPLPDEAKAIYGSVRDMFKQQYDQLQKSMENRVESLQADDKTKQALRAMMEKTFEQGRIDPYFPLSRYGDYWAVAKNADGEVLAYSQFENVEDQKDFVSAWRKAGAEVRFDRDTKAGKEGGGPKMAKIDPGFTLDVSKKIKDLGAASKETNDLIDDIWQTYLRSLPEMSARKQFIHRKGVLGFTADGLRSVADATLRNARRIAKVEYQYQIENEINELDEQATDNPDVWAQQTVDEMRQRHEWHMDHQGSAWASKLTGLGFHWFLGFARPSAAIVNLTQNVLVGMPVLSAFKEGSSFADMSIAAKDVATLMRPGVKNPWSDTDTNKRFSPDEKKAIHDIEEKFALFDKTRTHDLLGLQEAGGDFATSNWKKLGEVSGWLFHNTEVYNRKVMALASYRIARKKGMSHDAAVYKAVQLTEDAHFDYSSQNRPKFMQEDWARVAFLFRNYSINMYHYLARNFHDSLKRSGGTPEQRKAAARRFYGSMMATASMAGASGMPFVWSAIQGIEMVVEALDDDEDEEFRSVWDPKTRLREYLTDLLGVEGAAIIMDGALDGVPFAINNNTDLNVPNPTFSTRLTLANVAFQDAPADAPPFSDKWFLHYGGELVGPSVGLLQDGGQGLYELSNNNPRGLETIMPSSITDLMKTHRYAMDGVKSNAGNTVLTKEQLSASDYAVSAAGFAPYKVTRQYEENRARRFVDQRLGFRREALTDRYKNAIKYDQDRKSVV